MKQKLIKIVKVSCLTIILMLLLLVVTFLTTFISHFLLHFLSSDYVGIIFFMCCVFGFLFWFIWNDVLFDSSNDKELK